MRRSGIAWILIGTICSGCSPVGSSRSDDTAKVLAHLNFGQVKAGSRVVGVLRWANETTLAWRDVNIESSCPCVEVEPKSLTLAPGGMIMLRITLDLSSEPDYRGRLLVKIQGHGADGLVLPVGQAAVEVHD